MASVLFLDVEGAFPNAVTEQLLHKLRKRRISERYVDFIDNMLMGRRNRLKFDDYISEWFHLDNGIVQGDPLSMILYLFYNVDILDIARGKHELCLGSVDDLALVAMAKNFAGTHRMLKNMVVRAGGVREWSTSQNSRFEDSKSVLIDFSRVKNVERPSMELGGCTVSPQMLHRFLGVMVNQELRWRQHVDHALAKSTKWTLAFIRLARPGSGIRMKLMRQMFCAVVLPKMMYAADVWYTPTCRRVGAKKTSGSVGITKRLTSVQRIASTAITSALCTAPTDLLDLHAGIWPVHLLLHRVCHRATMRIASLPSSHPLHSLYRKRAKQYIKTHRAPMHKLAALYDIVPDSLEAIIPVRHPPAYEIKATVRVAGAEDGQGRGEPVWEEGVIWLYSDGSGLEGEVGAVAVMYKEGQEAKVLHYHLGKLTDHTVFEAEAVGVLLALHLLRNKWDMRKASIQINNQAVLGMLSMRKANPGRILLTKYSHRLRIHGGRA